MSTAGDIVIAGEVDNWYPMLSELLELDDPDFEPATFRDDSYGWQG